MSRILRRWPSPAMIVAFVALGVALAGTANALPGKSRVKKDDIARAAVRAKHIYTNAVRTKHIRSRNVTRSKIARRAVNSEIVGQDALTGENIVESSLSTVPNASKVNSRAVEKMSFVVAAGTAATQVLSLNGLVLTAACSAGPALSVTAGTAVSGAYLRTWGLHTGTGSFHVIDDSFNVGDSTDALPAAAGGTNISGNLIYVRTDGEVVTATFLAQETPTGCIFAGTATG